MEIELGTTALLGFENKGENANLKKNQLRIIMQIQHNGSPI